MTFIKPLLQPGEAVEVWRRGATTDMYSALHIIVGTIRKTGLLVCISWDGPEWVIHVYRPFESAPTATPFSTAPAPAEERLWDWDDEDEL